MQNLSVMSIKEQFMCLMCVSHKLKQDSLEINYTMTEKLSHPSPFFQFCDHDYDMAFLFPHHPPEVLDGVL